MNTVEGQQVPKDFETLKTDKPAYRDNTGKLIIPKGYKERSIEAPAYKMNCKTFFKKHPKKEHKNANNMQMLYQTMHPL